MEILFVVMLVCVVASLAIADARGVDKAGAVIMGLALGPLGVGIVLLMKPGVKPLPKAAESQNEVESGEQTYVKCPGCEGFTPSGSRFCNNCGQAMSQ